MDLLQQFSCLENCCFLYFVNLLSPQEGQLKTNKQNKQKTMPGGSRRNASKDSDVVILPWKGVQRM